jgi:hypothetical protein
MGWVTAPSGRRYLYRSVRRGGRVVREYLGRDDDFGRLMADEWRLKKLDAAIARQDTGAARDRVLERLARLERLADDDTLAAVGHGLMLGLGYHRHHRGGWRMRRQLDKLKTQIDALAEAARKPRPLIDYQAPADDAEAVALFAAARAGDADAVARLPALIRDRKWVQWIGDLGRQASHQLIWRVAKSDPVLKAGLQAKLADLWAELAGDNPTALETLLVRRVLNGWLLTHAAEIELALATDPKLQDRLDRLLARSQRRMTQAVGELARVRRLQAPAVFARLQLPAASGPAVTA